MEFFRKNGIYILIVIGILMLAVILMDFHNSIKNYMTQHSVEAGVYFALTAVIVLFGIIMCFKDKIGDKILDWQIKRGRKKKK